MELDMITILEIFLATVIICIPFVVLFNPVVKAKIRQKNQSQYQQKNDQQDQQNIGYDQNDNNNQQF